LVSPVVPTSAAKIWLQLGFSTPLSEVTVADLHWGHLKCGQQLGTVEGVFPRADAKVAIEKMKEGEAIEFARQQAILGKTAPPPAPTAPPSDTITIDDFIKVDLRVGLVKSAAPVKGADKLLHLHIDIGEPQPRSIVAGIALAYKPEALVGRKVVIVANLAPRKLRGLESQGMIVAASLGDGSPVLASFLEEVPIGARLK
jgi:methionyl-tRNA synthetase